MKKKKEFLIKDINQIKSLEELYNAVKPYLISPTEDVYKFIMQKLNTNTISKDELDILYEDDKTAIFAPHSEQASCLVGADADWCTAWGKYSYTPRHKSKYNHFTTYYNEYDDDITNMLLSFIDKQGKNHYQIDLDADTPEIKDAGDVQRPLVTMFNSLSDGAKKWFINMIKESSVINVTTPKNTNGNIFYKNSSVFIDDGKHIITFEGKMDLIYHYIRKDEYRNYKSILENGYIDIDIESSLSNYDEWDDTVKDTIKSILLPIIDEELSKDDEELGDDRDIIEELKDLLTDKNVTNLNKYFEIYLSSETINDALEKIEESLSDAKRNGEENATYNAIYQEFISTAISNVLDTHVSYYDLDSQNLYYYKSINGKEKLCIDVSSKFKKTNENQVKGDVNDAQALQQLQDYLDILVNEDEDVGLPYRINEPYYGFDSSDMDWGYISGQAIEKLGENF